jgi:hypothetical protein
MTSPVFIIGTMRSGSTLLRLMLDSHPNLSIGPESGFCRAVESIERIPDWGLGADWWARYDLTLEELDEHIRTFYDGIFSAHAASRGKKRWGEKTPFHVWHVPTLLRVFPDAQVVGIVRHPGATLVSTRKWGYTPEDAISKWVRANAEILRRAHEQPPARFQVVRYEDLVRHPRISMESLLAFLGEPWDESVLRHAEVQREQRAPERVEGGTRPADPVDAARADLWQELITPAERRLMEQRIPTELLRVLGYDLEDASPLPRARVEGAAIRVDAVDLKALPDGKLAAGAFDPERATLPTDPEELRHRLLRAERTLARLRTRRRRRLASVLREIGKPRRPRRGADATLSAGRAS